MRLAQPQLSGLEKMHEMMVGETERGFLDKNTKRVTGMIEDLSAAGSPSPILPPHAPPC